MDVFPKFIIETDDIEGDCLIIAKCTYHKQLVTDISKVKGGGWYEYKHEDNTFILYGSSHDLGESSIDDISACVKNNKVFRSVALHRKLEGFNYKYRTESGELIDINVN